MALCKIEWIVGFHFSAYKKPVDKIPSIAVALWHVFLAN